jgi:hypothetical protein
MITNIKYFNKYGEYMILKLAGLYGNFPPIKKSRLQASKRLLRKILSSGGDLFNKVDVSIPLEDLGSNFDGVRVSSDSLPVGVTSDQSDF